MKIKSLLLVAPLVLSAGFLASCNKDTPAEAAEWSKIQEGVTCYDEIAPKNYLNGLDASVDINSANLSGNLLFNWLIKGYSININRQNFSISVGSQKAIKETLPFGLIKEVIEGIMKDKPYETFNLTSFISQRLYSIVMPVNDYTMLTLNGYDYEEGGLKDYDHMISKPWQKSKATYKFNGDKLSQINIQIDSIYEFTKERNERFGSSIFKIADGDASINLSMNINTDTGYIKNINVSGKSSKINISNLDTGRSFSEPSFAFSGNFDFDVTLNLQQSFAKTITLQYKVKKYEPVVLSYDSDLGYGNYKFELKDKGSETFTDLKELQKKYDIDFEWETGWKYYFDDAMREKNIYFTKDTPANIGFEGIDYDVHFKSTKFGFILNSESNISTMDSSNNYPFKLVVDEKGTKADCYYLDGYTNKLSYGSSVKCGTVELTDDKIGEEATGYSPVRFYTTQNKFSVDQNNAWLHINGSKLDNDNGTYTVSLGVFEIPEQK